jgi:Tol biopolymer transport system component
VLDFGLAKIRAVELGADSTRTIDTVTEEGIILGTLQYMAPEQLEGREADARSDIFAFGAVVHEMATGKKVFEGKSRASVMAAILEREPPPLTTLNPLTPEPLDRAVKKCLAKDPEARWQTAADLEDELKWIAQSGSRTEVSTRTEGRHQLRERLGWLAAVFTALLSGVTIWRVTDLRPSPRPLMRFSIAAPHNAPLMWSPPALSPDGSRLVFEAGFRNISRLYLRPIDGFDATPIRGTESGTYPFLSPDGQFVAFYSAGKLQSVRVTGGVPQTICDTPDIIGGDWGPDGTILFANFYKGLWRVRASGGKPQPATTLDKTKGELGHLWPHRLAGKDAVLFTVQGPRSSDFHLAIESLTTHERRNLPVNGISPTYATTGHLVYARDGSLLAIPFDLASLEVNGSEASVIENMRRGETSYDQFALSSNGSLVYAVGPEALRTIVSVDRRGNGKAVAAPPRFYDYPRISPDGQRIAIEISDNARTDVWTYDLARDVLARLTYDGSSRCPTWTPDGKRILFNSSRAGVHNIFAQAADGGGQVEQLLPSEKTQWISSVSRDGQMLTFVQGSTFDPSDIWIMSMGRERNVRPLLRLPSTQYQGVFSPDGRWLAYVSDETGRFEVYVTSFPAALGKYQVSTEGGSEIAWAPSGRELFWRNEEKFMVAGVEPGASFAATKPKLLFSGYVRGWPGLPQYDVARDGSFLMLQASETELAPAQLNVVLNWFEELRKLTGGK